MQKYVFNWLVENKELAHLLNKTTRHLMYSGGHTTAQLILLKSLISLQAPQLTKERQLDNNNRAERANNKIMNITHKLDTGHTLHNLYRKCYPYVEATKRASSQKGSSNVSTVVTINQKRQQSLAIRWIVKNARSNGGNSMISKMTKELKTISSPSTKVYAPVLATHKLAEVGRT